MRKPIDPRNNGLKEPKQVLSKTGQIELNMEGGFHDSNHVRLQTVIDAWHKASKDHESQGHRLGEPKITRDRDYGRLALEYTYEWDNLNYSVEKAAFDAAIIVYDEEKKAYLEWEAGKPARVINLDYKIERARQRLANLEAHKDGKPLPFPDPE
jgi:Asp-tRNA(Asn)/Glu-tRNA(Gln) amidotransferase A subunit family amidase